MTTIKYFGQKKLIFKSVIITFLIVTITGIFSACTSANGPNINSDDPETAFSVAMKSFNSKDYLQAITDFSYIKVRFSGSAIVDEAQYYLAMSHFKRDDFILAAFEFETLIKSYPTSELVNQARFNMALSYFNLSPEYYLDQTYTQIAIDEFQNYIELYSDDPKVAEAKDKINQLRNKIALKYFKNAELYISLNEQNAALIYYDYVLKDYFDSQYADDALLGKITVLVNKKKYDLAREEIKRFEELFSSSSLLGSVHSLKNKIPL